MNQLFFIVLAALQVLIFLILLFGKLFTSTGDAAGKPYVFTRWDKVLIIATILSIGVTIDLFIIAEKEGRETRSVFDHQKDSLNKLNQAQQELLARNGYQVDTAGNKIAGILKDSFKTNTLVIKESVPDFGLCNSAAGIRIDSVKENTCFLRLCYSSGQVAASGIRVKTVLAVFADGDAAPVAVPLASHYLFPFDGRIGARDSVKISVNITLGNAVIIYCLLDGIYFSQTGDKTYPIRKIYWLDVATGKTGLAEPLHFRLVDNFYKRQGY
jgi:hypothetical protein